MHWFAGAGRVLVALVVAAGLTFGTAHAASTLVTAVVCASANGSVISLTSPHTDSTINSGTVTISGNVKQAQSVSIAVDGATVSTVPLDTLNQDFSTNITLTQGTHDITLSAPDVCHIKNGTASAVITYLQGAVPTQGGSVPTVVPAQPLNPVAAGATTKIFGDPSKIDGLSGPNGLPSKVIDAAKPTVPVSATPFVIAAPFVVGAGAFGWIHLRRLLR